MHRIHHHQIRHLLLKAKIHRGNEVRMAQAGADMRFGVNEILHLLIATTILPIEHRGETFDVFPRRSHLHTPLDRSTPVLNRGATGFLLHYHNHALFMVIELLALINIFRSLVACLLLRGAPWLPR